jgi:hypothetical protein
MLTNNDVEKSNRICAKFPDKVPVILTSSDRTLKLSKEVNKFLVPKDLNISQFIYTLRKNHLQHLNPEEAIVRLNLEEEDPIDLIILLFQGTIINLLKLQAQEEALNLVIQEVLVHLQEEEEAEKRISPVL